MGGGVTGVVPQSNISTKASLTAPGAKKGVPNAGAPPAKRTPNAVYRGSGAQFKQNNGRSVNYGASPQSSGQAGSIPRTHTTNAGTLPAPIKPNTGQAPGSAPKGIASPAGAGTGNVPTQSEVKVAVHDGKRLSQNTSDVAKKAAEKHRERMKELEQKREQAKQKAAEQKKQQQEAMKQAAQQAAGAAKGGEKKDDGGGGGGGGDKGGGDQAELGDSQPPESKPLNAKELQQLKKERGEIDEFVKEIQKNDDFAKDKQLQETATNTNESINSAVQNGRSARSGLAKAKEKEQSAVTNIGKQNETNEQKLSDYKQKAGQLKQIGTNTKTAPPFCMPKPVAFTPVSPASIGTAKTDNTAAQTALTQAQTDATAMGANVTALHGYASYLGGIGALTASKGGSGNANAFQLIQGQADGLARYLPMLQQAIAQGNAGATANGSAIASSENAIAQLQSAMGDGNKTSASINGKCTQIMSSLLPAYIQGQALIQMGRILSMFPPTAAQGQQLQQQGKQMKDQAEKTTKQLKQQMIQEATTFETNLDGGPTSSQETAKSGHEQANTFVQQFEPPLQLP